MSESFRKSNWLGFTSQGSGYVYLISHNKGFKNAIMS